MDLNRTHLPNPQHIPGRIPLSGLSMTSFDQDEASGRPAHNGPILVAPPRRKLSRLEIWRNRIFLLEVLFVCCFIGIILIIAPWTPYWTDNSLLTGFPRLKEFLMYDFVRGLISGLGLTDIWLGVSEVVRYREHAG